MSWPAIRWAFVQKVGNASERAVLSTLAHYARKPDARAWPSLETLAANCGMCERSVYSTIRRLAKSGLLEIEGHRRRRKYRLCLEAGQPVGANEKPDMEGGEDGKILPEAGNICRLVGNDCRRSNKDPTHNLRERRGTAAAAAPSRKKAAGKAPAPDEPLSPQQRWEKRVRVFRAEAFWASDWGPRPDAQGCLAPEEVLRRFGYGEEVVANLSCGSTLS
jgi:hypothetical protein